ncbi:hypothetical protein D9758_009579 [Tetrapyrgos nigripes]|uniref:Uncharacterized protein n=1 Tax=Tetrapyrgos nigripes TaxID=182062 RepID=A0A8H5LMG5_9AGAR|nr:hypothetical protein D9758_009579 [Tetrapyrgos nigripes]
MDTERISQRKATFSIAPNPPSPTDSLLPLTNSASNSSTSPPPPSTPPPRYHSRPRYPNDLGRVPLHRRGTSQRYEPFEDLLREAGYKETRVFTPESERTAGSSHDDAALSEAKDQRSSGRAVGAVVDFLSGLIPGPTLKRSTSLRQSFTTAVDEVPRSDVPSTPTLARHQPSSPSLLSPRQSSRRHVQRPLDPNQSSISSLEDLDAPAPKAQDHRGKVPPTRPRPTSHVAEHNLPYSHNNTSYTSLNHYSHRYHHGPLHSHSNGGSQPQSHTLYRNTSSASTTRRNSNRSPAVQPLSPLPQSSYESRQITHTIYRPVPSRATAYLRHMASVPNMPRPSSTPAHQSLLHAQQQQNRGMFRTQSRDDDDDEELFSPLTRGDGEAETDAPPPLPRTWLETVARAVLSGGAGAFAGGPASSSMLQRSASNPPGHHARLSPALRQTRSVISRTQVHESERDTKLPRSRSGLSDHTNRGPPYMGERSIKSAAPATSRDAVQPELLSRIGRSTTSEGGVRKTRVVCRSAPTSRASSPVKNRKVDRSERKGMGSGNAVDYDDNVTTDRGRKDKKGLQRVTVPTLARTRVEGDDVWHRKVPRDKKAKRSKVDDGNRYLNEWNWDGGNGNESDVSYSASEDEDEDDEEDGELDLARMLVPPKRQNSIHSLRKHLISTHNNGVVAGESGITGRGSSSGLTRRGSTSVYDSGNSRIFRRWFVGNRMSEYWEDPDEGESESSGSSWFAGATMADLQRRLVAEHEALERFLSDDAGAGGRESHGQQLNRAEAYRSFEGPRSSRNGTRRGLPNLWIDTAQSATSE